MTTSYDFNAGMVAGAPDDPGVYVLYRNGQIIYIGKADVSIKTRLQCHLNGAEGPCTQKATHYAWEITYDAGEVERRYLAQYKAQFRKLPECNDVMPAPSLASLADMLKR